MKDLKSDLIEILKHHKNADIAADEIIKIFEAYYKDKDLPVFLYRDSTHNDIKIGYRDDTVVTDEWNEYILIKNNC